MKRLTERVWLGAMVEKGHIDKDSELWLWHCVADYFTHA